MADFLKKNDYSLMSMPKAMNRTNPSPLDASAIWTSLDELRNYAANDPTAYIGQILSLVAYNAETEVIDEVKAYIIKDASGAVEEVGSATLGDDVSIELDNGTLSLKDFGKYFYKYVAADEEAGTEAGYVRVAVDASNPWKAGLQPNVALEDGKYILGWYEPNPTTAEGVNAKVIALEGEMAGVKERLGAAETSISAIQTELYGSDLAEGDGLVDRVSAVENGLTNVYTKSETYNKDEVDSAINAKVSGVFSFKGTYESLDALNAAVTAPVNGDVYQVGDAEYAWNGTAWVFLGINVDLTPYAKAADVAASVETLENADTEIKGRLDNLESADETLNGLIEDLANADTEIHGLIDGLEAVDEGILSRVADLEAADEGHDSAIEALQQADQGIIERLGTLETAKSGFDTAIGNLQNEDTSIKGRLDTLERKDATHDTDIAQNAEDIAALIDEETGRIPVLEQTVEGHKSAIADLEAVSDQLVIDVAALAGAEANLIDHIFVGDTELVPTEKKVVIPTFAGVAAGLVPAPVGDIVLADSFLNANGDWVNVADKIQEFMSWEQI